MLCETSRQTLLDLVEIKLSCIEVWNRDDRRELESLERAREELRALGSGRRLASVEAQPHLGRPPSRRIIRTAAC